MIDLKNLTLNDIQPSQFYISEEKVNQIKLWFDKNKMEKFEPIPIKLLSGVPVMTDGHTRAVVALQSGLNKVPLVWDEDDLNWAMYEKCVEACIEKNIRSPHDLLNRVISKADYKSLWHDWCDEMQKNILGQA